jgi:PST family polysaccharide transporter
MPGVAFMIATSDWLVLFLLGSHWREAGPNLSHCLVWQQSFNLLPGQYCGCLRRQGRAGEIFKWGIMGGIIAVASIVAGLPWGARGVATSYAVTDLFSARHFCSGMSAAAARFALADIYRTIVTRGLCFDLNASSCCLFVHQWLEVFPPDRHATIYCLWNYDHCFVAWSWPILPAGRAAMQNFKEMLLLALQRKTGSRCVAFRQGFIQKGRLNCITRHQSWSNN